MLLAAGRGERLRPVTDTLPKALVDVRGQPLIERHLQALAQGGIANVVINLGWLGEQIGDHLGSGRRFGMNIVYSREGDNVLETLGGIQRALPLLGSAPFLVVNADVLTDMPLPGPLPTNDEAGHLVLVPTPAYKARGDFDLVDNKVRNGDEPAFTFSGIAVYRPEFFADCEPGRASIVPLIRQAADRGELGGSVYRGMWEDIGTPERLEAINLG